MADNFTFAESGGSIGAADDCAGVKYPRYKDTDGAADSTTVARIMTTAAAITDAAKVVQNPRSDVFVGGLTDAAPATDTASASLNGRMQRLAQRLTTALITSVTPYHLRSAGSNNATSLKNSAGSLYMCSASNTNAAARYLKFYNKASAPAPATDSALLVQSYLIPPNTSGTNIPIPEKGLAFSTGIAFAIVVGEGDTDNTSVSAGDVHINLGWL